MLVLVILLLEDVIVSMVDLEMIVQVSFNFLRTAVKFKIYSPIT